MFRPLLSACTLLLFCLPARGGDCAFTQLNDARAAIRNAPGCQAGIAFYESCGARASSYVNLGTLAEEARMRCEKIFLNELHGRTRRIYKSRQSQCYGKYLKNASALFHTPRAVCMPYLAEDYARRFLLLKEEQKNNPSPPL